MGEGSLKPRMGRGGAAEVPKTKELSIPQKQQPLKELQRQDPSPSKSKDNNEKWSDLI